MSKLSEWKMVRLAVAGVALSLLANVVRADSFSDQAAKLDVVGVHLGMTPAQVKSVLDQHRKGMQWDEKNGDLRIGEAQFLVRATAEWQNPEERVAVVFSPPPGDPKVVAVSRDLEIDQSQSPTVESLASSLTGKFGEPSQKSQTNSAGREFVWAWDKAGQVSKPNQNHPNICLMGGDNRMGGDYRIVRALQEDDDGGCALVVRASISCNPHINSGIAATRLQMALNDSHDALQAAIATDSHVKQVEQAWKEKVLKKASANKPPAL